MNDDLCLISTAIACYTKLKYEPNKSNKRSKWVKNWLQKRSTYSHVNLLNDLRLDPDDWRNYLRYCNENGYHSTQRLSTTLRFLATGRSMQDLKYSVAISPQSLGQIIPETCTAICKVLWRDYLKFPNSEDEWKEISRKFETKWNFPHCLGAVDGKHVSIACPPKSSSFYYNYKGFFSLVLMAIVNANYEFILCDFGTNGRVSDGGVIENTNLYNKLKNNTLNIPSPCEFKGSKNNLPYVFIGDEAFSLKPNFLKPYNQKELNYEHKVFNYRLSRARNVVENAFGILSARFRIFHTPINMKLENIERAVLACCTLHNFLRRNCKDSFMLSNEYNDNSGNINIDKEGLILTNLQRGHNRHAGEEAKEVREIFLKYFNEEGCVAWQHNRVTAGKD
ncbi:uncharacterized protein LOC132937465 [Metopolophium dirhodum]|uniref:uncharacterized protein LOC132937465 n=1 Tax=Metopolophium dirhodum TaxID=44670 RepID=UPI002990353F|nr:uncharacterized protein LOC132937465 [Metopolophium dirhodum]